MEYDGPVYVVHTYWYIPLYCNPTIAAESTIARTQPTEPESYNR